MDAWEILISNSTLTPGPGIDAWTHLNNQAGGGGGKTYISDKVLEFDIEPLDIAFTPQLEEVVFDVTIPEVEFNADPIAIEFVAQTGQLEFKKKKITTTIVSKNANITFIGEEV